MLLGWISNGYGGSMRVACVRGRLGMGEAIKGLLRASQRASRGWFWCAGGLEQAGTKNPQLRG